MRPLSALLVIVAIASPLAAQPATRVVEMSNFKFAPAQLELRANTPVVLQLRNDSSGGHSLTAPEFFAASRVDPGSARYVQAGRVEVPGHQAVTLSLTPAAGQYPLKCSHTLHSVFGMKGIIVVR
ncbi:cupredoxin domain-containing protein [Sphingomonas sp.]|uniref:cupredoxin domain-containing protein n=1 Tax=Sphingomonas sp. TaxID=28214 RepID=UPI0025D00840|nr:cupredoxin domain-containing protein [Sphingomonas sp.]MBV9528917.1 cupredoxin domain-containing protein [Sphingomonas sp.]